MRITSELGRHLFLSILLLAVLRKAHASEAILSVDSERSIKSAEQYFEAFLQTENMPSVRSAVQKGIEGLYKEISNNTDAWKLATTEEKRARSIFRYFSKHYLKEYRLYANLAETFYNGTYNCVTATAILGYAYQSLGYEVEIHERIHHVYLVVKTKDLQEFWIEGTDPVHGFKTTDKQKERLLYTYIRTEKSVSARYDSIITERQLAALQFYNRAVTYYHDRDVHAVMYQIAQADILYPTERNSALFLMAFELGRQCAVFSESEIAFYTTSKNKHLERLRSAVGFSSPENVSPNTLLAWLE